jgi:hypothetical protein
MKKVGLFLTPSFYVGSRIGDEKVFGFRSGINIPDPQHGLYTDKVINENVYHITDV